MPVWTDTAKFKLLLAMIDSMNVDKLPEWDVVASKMGSEYTREAVRQQFQKIRKNAKAELNGDSNTGTATPRKRGSGSAKPTPSSKTSPQKRAREKAPSSKGADGDGDDEHESPSKHHKSLDSSRLHGRRGAIAGLGDACDNDEAVNDEVEDEEA